MKVIGAVTIGKLIEAHYEKDEHKFKSYAEFIADAYNEMGEERAERIIRSRIDGSYKDKPTENGNKMLFDLVGDLYDLVVLARKNNTNPVAIKTDRIWREQIYPLLKEYDLQVFIYNKKHNKKLPFIKDRIGLEVKASVR